MGSNPIWNSEFFWVFIWSYFSEHSYINALNRNHYKHCKRLHNILVTKAKNKLLHITCMYCNVNEVIVNLKGSQTLAAITLAVETPWISHCLPTFAGFDYYWEFCFNLSSYYKMVLITRGLILNWMLSHMCKNLQCCFLLWTKDEEKKPWQLCRDVQFKNAWMLLNSV